MNDWNFSAFTQKQYFQQKKLPPFEQCPSTLEAKLAISTWNALHPNQNCVCWAHSHRTFTVRADDEVNEQKPNLIVIARCY